MNGLGVVFDIDELGGGFYASQAWRIFMRLLPPENIIACLLREGDTNETLNGSRREFCIAVVSAGLDVESVKKAFADSSEKGLAASDRRFILSPQLDSEPLVEAGMVDFRARLVQDEWSRSFHDRCKDSGWGYAPKKITVDLPSELKSELKTLENRATQDERSAREITSPDVDSDDANEVEQFRSLVKRRLEHYNPLGEMTSFGPRVMPPQEKEEIFDREVLAFAAGKDPLFRSVRYREWLLRGVIEKEDLANDALLHVLIGAIANKLTRNQLAKLIEEYDTLRRTISASELGNRQFKVNRGWFRKAFTIDGATIGRLLPKLRLLAVSPVWKAA